MYKIKIFLTAATFILSMFAARAQTPTPGGVNNAGYTWQVWLTPDSYDMSTGVWTNQITGTNSAGNFYAPLIKPAKVDRGYNFHPSVEFTKTSNTNASKRLRTSVSVAIAQGQNVTSFFVYKRANITYYDYLFSFNDGNANGDLTFYTTGNALRLYWPGTNRGTVLTAYEGMIAVDNSNTASNQVISYLNGVQQSSIGLGSGTGTGNIPNYNSPWTIGANGSTASSGYGFEGVIQEIIILKASGTGNHIESADLQKIHSYLGLKYGISVNNAKNYLASDGTVTWDTLANTGYNRNIFGIGRDDATGLHQKQSISTSNSQITLFLGNRLEAFNSQNSAVMGDKQFLVIGSDGQPAISSANITDGTGYENGNINAPNDLNFQSGIYKAQLTGMTAIAVNLKVKSDYSHVFVSPDANFTPGQTMVYTVNASKITAITIDAAHKYIRFAGYDAGPGGVNANLRLWLRADNEGALTLEDLPVTDQKLVNFPTSELAELAVQEWKDPIRNKIYSWAQGNSEAAHRIPVYEPNNLMMNYHPSVHFWGTNSYGSYLATTSAITTVAQPAAHTAYFVTSNDFNTNRWFYTMMFGSATSNINYNGPGYGVDSVSTAGITRYVGRLRTNGGAADGTVSLFTKGSTSILGYYQNGQNIKFRFNGKEDSRTFLSGSFNMTAPSMIGKGYSYDRTVIGVMSEVIIFERELNAGEQRQLESYLAIKYGATLRPANTATNRFDYTLSDGTVFWQGNTPESDPVLGKYATFYNNISAVIRDDAAKLHNVQSHSTDAGSILHMGVAGTKLGKNFDVGELPFDLEAIAWGSNSEAGIIAINNPDPCADFTGIFKKKWMVHKLTDQPIAMLVGAQDNTNNVLGSSVSADINSMYGKLGIDNEVYLIVADSPEKLDPADPAYGDFKVVLPMRHIEGEQQCIYTFSDSIVYITFGYKPSRNQGCYSTLPAFSPKTYNWNTQWTRRNYNLNGIGVKTIPATPVVEDLGEGVTVTTKIVYANGVRANTNYPRFTTNPRNSLEIQRRYGTSDNDSKVTTTITFSTPVSPSFKISGLDTRNGQRDRITVKGVCPGGVVFPTLKSAGGTNPTYRIQGNTAIVSRRGTVSASNLNGTVDVMFTGSGVQEIEIEYNIARTSNSSGAQSIFISPITIENVPNMPIYNENGLALTKWTNTDDITTCENVEYRFLIHNGNIVPKYVHFTDVLPDSMKWVAGTVGLDTINMANSDIIVNNYGGTKLLDIDSLLVPCNGSTLFTAIARPDIDAPSDIYRNRAKIVYEIIKNNVPSLDTLKSQNGSGIPDSTAIDIDWAERKDSVTLKTQLKPLMYAANGEILVTLELTNPNIEDITDMFLDLEWDAGFKYIAGSWSSNVAVIYCNASDSTMEITGNGAQGFILQGNSTSFFSFKLLAPNTAYLEHELDENGQPTKEIVPLNIFYEFNSEMDDSCLMESLKDLSGILEIPYGAKNFIITNKHITTKISK